MRISKGIFFYHCGLDNSTNFVNNSRSRRRILMNFWRMVSLTSNKLFDFHDWDPGILRLNFCHCWIGATCKNFAGSAALAGFDIFELN